MFGCVARRDSKIDKRTRRILCYVINFVTNNMIEEVKKSLEKNLDEKLVSPFWGAYVSSWLVWNWKIWYVTFFVDSSLLMQSKNILKVEYLSSFYPWGHWLNIFFIFLPPVLFSFLIVFWLPEITKFYYAKALDFEYANKSIKERKEAEFLKIKIEKLYNQEEVLKKEKYVEEIRSGKTQEDVWEEEYKKFKSSKFFKDFRLIRQRIYENNGYIRSSNFSLPSEITAYYHANDIIEGVGEGGDRVKITEKGKYFMRRFSEES